MTRLRIGKLSRTEIRQAFEDGRSNVPPILSPKQLAELLGISRSTLYEWAAKGRLDGSFRRRGKHIRFWRDRVLLLFFDGPRWGAED